MIIYIASDGQARLVSPQHVYQGSNVTDITVIAPFPAQTAMTVAFELPAGKMFGGVQGTMQTPPTPPYMMTLLPDQSGLPDGVQAWQYVMTSAITQNAGQAKVSITAQFAQGSGQATSFTQQTSAQVEFTIEPSVVGTLPDEPTPDVWTQILSYLSAQDTKIAAIQSDVADIEQVADEANTNAGAALTTANEANTTATQAKTTADGLADSIAQANETASQANATAEEAKEIAEGAAQGNGTRVSVGGAFQQTLSFASDPQTQITANKNAIAEAQSDINDIISGAQTVGKAKQDANGNVIDETYAKLSQAVRTDTAQSLNPTQQLQAQKNIYPAVTDLNNVPLPFGTCSQIFTFSVNTANAPTTDGGTLIQSVYDGYNGGHYTQTVFMNTASGGEIYTRRHSGANGWTNWQRYMSIDPTTLTPSTANGWTLTTKTGSLPSDGVYMVVPGTNQFTYGIGIMFHTENRPMSAAAMGVAGSAVSLVYDPSGDTKWSLYNTEGTTLLLNSVFYKRIA